MKKPRVCVLRTDGTNCDAETKRAFDLVGGEASIVLLESLITGKDPVKQRPERLDDYDILAIPGGFSYGDYIASGRVFVEYLKLGLGDKLFRFIEQGKPVIGICNGFQVLTKAGILGVNGSSGEQEQTVTLTYNESYRFRCDWVNLVRPDRSDRNKCIWTRGIESIDLPIAHGEGRFVAKSLLPRLFEEDQVVFQYAGPDGKPSMDIPYNPNGSEGSIAGICNKTGTVFGLMPHPERYSEPHNHRLATLQKVLGTLPDHGLGLDIFRNGVEYCR